MTYPLSKRLEIIALADAGVPISEIVEKRKVSKFAVYSWLKKRGKIEVSGSIANIKKQLAILTARPKITDHTSRKIAMLSKAMARLERTARIERRAARPKPVLDSLYKNRNAKKLREKACSQEYGLYQYQKDFLRADNQFRVVLKARQIGYSYTAALDALIAAVAGRDQLFLSASKDQAMLLGEYCATHAKKLGVPLEGASDNLRVGDARIRILAHNFRTAQGYPGDIWLDEFAWYPNPKLIWGIFVPSIGAVKGRLTIMSTPFEQGSMFEKLCKDETRYHMFRRFRTDIYDAMKDGFDFDLDVMRSLFDADTWASRYECMFIDDDAAMFGIDLIKSCVEPDMVYHLPPSSSLLWAGYDIGRIKDMSALAYLQPHKTPKNEIYKLRGMDMLAKTPFDEQESHLKRFMTTWPLAQLRIDRTGIGMQLAESIRKRFGGRSKGVYFTNATKEFMVLNLKKIFEDKLIRIPNQPELISDIHAIKRRANMKSFSYDADRNAHGHADRFWALALAAMHIKIIGKTTTGKAWII